MYRVKVHKNIERIISFLYSVRIWHRGDEETVAERRLKLFYSIYYSLLPISLVAGALASDNSDEFVFLVEASIMFSVLLVKFLFVSWRKKEILEQLNRLCEYDVEDRETFTQINDKLNSLMKFVTVLFSFMYFSAICASLVVPFLGAERTLFFPIGFPLDWRNNEFAFWMAFMFLFTEAIISAIVATLFTLIILYLMFNCSLRYVVLGQQIQVMGEIKSVDETAIQIKVSNAEHDKLYGRELVEAITAHQHLTELKDQLASLVSALFLVQLATSGLCICTSTYSLAFNRGDNLFEIVINLTALLYSIFDIFMVMHFGNEIQLGSDRLSYCLFESNWTDRSQSIKKNVLIFGEFLMKPHQLVLLKLYPLNLETFMRIMNSAYSMFNILLNLK